MQVALIHYRIAKRGGLETRLINYTQYFVEQGHSVTIICAKNTGQVTFSPLVNIVKLNMGIVPKPLRRMYFNHKVGTFLKTKTFDFELSLGRTSYQKAVLGPSNHKGFLKAMNKSGRGIGDFAQNYLDQKLADNCQIIFAASQMMKNEFIELYKADSDKIKIIYPPLNTQQFGRVSNKKQMELRHSYGVPLNVNVFVFVSASHYRKGLDILLSAFKMLENKPVLLLVAGYPKVETQLKNVRFVGFANKPQELYQLADCCLHPARYEPFGQIVSESLACGKPVITSNMCGGKEILTPKTGKVISSFNPNKWATEIEQFKPEDYSVPIDFVEQKGLGLNNHMKKMLDTYFA
ncbi:MAG: glycosyltransferase family 4 protein [Bacteroidia bacterium]